MGLFQNTGARTQARPGELRISLAAFGKHPGWDDHISGIGVETDVLAHIKQSLYVGGIGRQIDLGSWEKLDPEKRVAGFDHTFVWFRAGHVLLGRFWSSTDRKGRSKYPMVLCIDAEGVAPGILMANGGAELERLRETCKATNSADQVTLECGTAQDRLRAQLEGMAQQPSEVAVEQKQRFLESRALGPDRVGLLRVLHELDNALGVSSGGRASGPAAMANLHPYHIRVPLCLGSPGEALPVWSEFLRSVLPHAVPLMLIARNGVDWLDVIVGEPSGDDFFCLQASPQALPLATEIPYELGPDLKLRLQEMEGRFRAAESAGDTGGTIFIKKPSAATGGGNGELVSARPKRKSWLWLSIGVVLVLGAAGAWLLSGRHEPARSPPAAKPLVEKTDPATQINSLLAEGRKAMTDKDYSKAAQQFEQALRLRPEDAEIKGSLAKAQEQIASAKDDAAFADALKAGQQALGAGQFDDAQAQLKKAQTLKPGEPRVLELLARVTQQQRTQQDYQQAIAVANGALASKNFDTAMQQANLALKMKPGDAAATKLKIDIEGQQREAASAAATEADSKRKYEQSMAAAQAAFDRLDYATALAQAVAALETRPNDPAAVKLKGDVERRQRDIAAQTETDRKYKQAMVSAQAALDSKDYTAAAAQAGAALAVRFNDPAATQLLSQVKQAKRAQEQAAKNEQDYQQALTAAQQALAAKQYDEVARQVNLALNLKPGDAAAGLLLSQAQQEKKAQEQALLAEKKPIAPTPPANPVLAVKTTTVEPKTPVAVVADQAPSVEKCDMDLRNLMIQLHVKPLGPNVTTNGGTAVPLLRGFLPADTIDQYVKQVVSLRKNYQDHKWLDPERKKDLDRLNDAILDWNQ